VCVVHVITVRVTELMSDFILTLFKIKLHSQYEAKQPVAISFLYYSALKRGSAAARLLGLWVRILLGAWISVSCECCVLSGRGLCDG
jgi:hypothetical protein